MPINFHDDEFTFVSEKQRGQSRESKRLKDDNDKCKRLSFQSQWDGWMEQMGIFSMVRVTMGEGIILYMSVPLIHPTWKPQPYGFIVTSSQMASSTLIWGFFNKTN